jgi:hypothetical protein
MSTLATYEDLLETISLELRDPGVIRPHPVVRWTEDDTSVSETGEMPTGCDLAAAREARKCVRMRIRRSSESEEAGHGSPLGDLKASIGGARSWDYATRP